MPEFSSHAPGTFCWPELATTDQKGGVAFYRALLGWDVIEQPIGPADVYSMFTLRGLEVAAASTMQADERQLGVPPHWNAYVAVADADQSAKRAQELGGKVLAPAFDVMDAGRMAVLQDPQGAVISVWQAKRHIGAKVLREPGALGWTELLTNDTGGRRDVLHAALRLEGEGQSRVYRVQRRLDAGCRHDEARPELGQRAAALDAVLPGH